MSKYIQRLAPYLEGNPSEMTQSQRERVRRLPKRKFNAILLFVRHQFASDQPLSWKQLSRMRLICLVACGGPEVITALNRMEDYIIPGVKYSCERFWNKLKVKVDALKKMREREVTVVTRHRSRYMPPRNPHWSKAILSTNGCSWSRAHLSS